MNARLGRGRIPEIVWCLRCLRGLLLNFMVLGRGLKEVSGLGKEKRHPVGGGVVIEAGTCLGNQGFSHGLNE